MSEKGHHVVGRRFRAYGNVYDCVKWRRNDGYYMRTVSLSQCPVYKSENVGDERSVSERAIGTTFREIWDREERVPHSAGCQCYVCDPRDGGT